MQPVLPSPTMSSGVPPSYPPAMDEALPTVASPSPSADDDSEGHESGGHSATRKSRQNFSGAQLQILELVFISSPLPRKNIRAQLAEQLALPIRSVQVWFQNRRQKWKTTYRASLMSHVQQQAAAAAAASSLTSTFTGGQPISPHFAALAAVGSPELQAAPLSANGSAASGPELAALQEQWQSAACARLPHPIVNVQCKSEILASARPTLAAHVSAHSAARQGAAAVAVVDESSRASRAACEGLLLLSSCAQTEAAGFQNTSLGVNTQAFGANTQR
ncbi:hypothetical protein T492DRAFT_1047875 [Pavlovales sp. CCMP2436]|nr:hypothetical protein T492DRAFT_1047875 [Pavlovales sp. CCMP2436]|mmetsp:Transcript_34072/g.80288  ORF Transcript_34072/g.80288 Transcript_34072/m.80288 type:complete len:276 (-) Transcript_34072:468-1295(-)